MEEPRFVKLECTVVNAQKTITDIHTGKVLSAESKSLSKRKFV